MFSIREEISGWPERNNYFLIFFSPLHNTFGWWNILVSQRGSVARIHFHSSRTSYSMEIVTKGLIAWREKREQDCQWKVMTSDFDFSLRNLLTRPFVLVGVKSMGDIGDNYHKDDCFLSPYILLHLLLIWRLEIHLLRFMLTSLKSHSNIREPLIALLVNSRLCIHVQCKCPSFRIHVRPGKQKPAATTQCRISV